MRTTAETLATALARGVISPAQLDALQAIATEHAPGMSAAGATAAGPGAPQDDEKLRFITGFGDIFVTIGLAMFLGGLSYMGGGLKLGSTAALVAVASWLLAEYFTLRQRMALPSIVLLVVYAASVYLALASALTGAGNLSALGRSSDTLAAALAGMGTCGAVGLHYWRFRVPITPAAGAAALVLTVLSLAKALAPITFAAIVGLLQIGCGLAVFALAMGFDLSDPRRRTRRTDIAFWLHMLAAPLIVHPLLGPFATEARVGDGGAAGPILAVFAALAVVAILVDWRALLVSGLTSAGIAFGALVRSAGMTSSVPLTLLALGAFVLLLSAAWHPLRRAILSLLPRWLAARLPNPSTTAPS